MHFSEMSAENRGVGGYSEGGGGGHPDGEEGEGHQEGPGGGSWPQGGEDQQESGRGLEQRSSRGRARVGDERVEVAARSSLKIILISYVGSSL